MSLLQATLEAAPCAATDRHDLAGVRFRRGPLALSSGAGSGAQVAIGTGVLGGIVTATVLAVFLVPLFFLVVGRLFRLRKAPRTGTSPRIPTGKPDAPSETLAPHPGTVRRAARRLPTDASAAARWPRSFGQRPRPSGQAGRLATTVHRPAAATDDRLRAGAIRRASLNSAVLFPP